MHIIGFNNCRAFFTVALCAMPACGLLVSSAVADLMVLTPDKDATLYSYAVTYDAADAETFPKADGVTHLHVGDTNNNKGVQRGLVQFDLSGIPSDAVVTDVSLTLKVADVPSRVLLRDINFWLLAMEGLSMPWAQGPGPGMGTGDQQPAVPGDATWFHTEYTPSLHGELGNTSGNEFRGYVAGDPGYWSAPGYFGNDELTATAAGAGAGGLFDDAHALVLPAGVDGKVHVDDEVAWSNARMLSDVQAWVAGTKANFGWIMVGEEWIDSSHTVIVDGKTKTASSKIDFYSSETGEAYSAEPTLSVTYSAVPEPGAVVLMLLGLATLLLRRVR
ncbi:MAG: PEP-CTERM sorting domain-containing protein [Planctomycetota bacterium]|nr:PEP-CTERM sorting domain-containing protein [Planctomycetota bacterium]